MDILKVIARAILGLVLIASGVLLLIYYDPSRTLPLLLAKFPPYKGLSPYYLSFFRVNASLFCAAGFFTILNSKLATLAQAIGSLMFILTYDNFMLYHAWDLKIQKILYIIVHIIVIAAISECHNERKDVDKGGKEKTKVE